MRGGKEHARQAQPVILDGEPRASTSAPVSSMSATVPSESVIRDETVIQPSSAQPSDPDGQSGFTARSSSESDSGIYHNVLVECNSLVKAYRKGEISKAAVYIEIQGKLARALNDNRGRSDAAFGLFIATIESHDSEVGAAVSKGRVINPLQRPSSPVILISDDLQSDGEPDTKRIKVDESAYAWVTNRQFKHTSLWDSLRKTLRLIKTYTIDPKVTKRSLVNEPDCPEFLDSEWKNIIAGRAVNLNAVLSRQLSTTHDDPKIKKFRDLEIMFGVVEPTKVVKNGGDWSIAWNRTVRATLFAFPHRIQELSSYGEYIINLFSTLTPACIAESLPSTRPSGKESEVSETSNYRILRSLLISKSCT